MMMITMTMMVDGGPPRKKKARDCQFVKGQPPAQSAPSEGMPYNWSISRRDQKAPVPQVPCRWPPPQVHELAT
jgi:hypothetical protein